MFNYSSRRWPHALSGRPPSSLDSIAGRRSLKIVWSLSRSQTIPNFFDVSVIRKALHLLGPRWGRKPTQDMEKEQIQPCLETDPRPQNESKPFLNRPLHYFSADKDVGAGTGLLPPGTSTRHTEIENRKHTMISGMLRKSCSTKLMFDQYVVAETAW